MPSTSDSPPFHGSHRHSHPHTGPHRHLMLPRRSQPTMDAHEHAHPHHDHGHGHDHSHGLVHDSIKRSQEGIRAVSLSLAVLGLTAPPPTAAVIAPGTLALVGGLT